MKHFACKLTAIIMAVMIGIVFFPAEGLAVESEVTESPTVKAGKDNAVMSQNTENSTTFNMGDGKKKTVFYSDSMRYKDEQGNLVDYDPVLVVTNEKDGYSYKNNKGDTKQYIPEELTKETPVLLEKGKYRASFIPVEETMNDEYGNYGKAKLKSEKTATAYEEEKVLPVTAEYEAKDKSLSLEYISVNTGIKENLILNKMPDTNIKEFEIKMKGMYPKKNITDEGITFYDKNTDKITASIAAPFMNDASKTAYNDNITQSIREKEGEKDTYIITIALDEDYLADSDRQYPVTVDPSFTWDTNSEFWSVYVGSGYKNTNFHDSGIKIINAGKNSTGIFRTYLRFNGFPEKIKGKSVTKATVALYETGSGTAGQTVQAHRVTENWTRNGLTWNNRPGYVSSSCYDSFKTSRTSKTKKNLDMTSHARAVADGKIVSYGIMLRNKQESSNGYTEFYNARYATEKYRPKMTVTYYDKPTTAGSTSLSSQYIKKGANAKLSWSGIKSSILSSVQYRIAACNDEGTVTNETVVPYTATGVKTVVGTVNISKISTLAEGRYNIYARGVDVAGYAGTGKKYTFYIDGTAPTISATISNVSTKSAPSKVKSPEFNYIASDKYGASAQYRIDGKDFKNITTVGKFQVPENEMNKTGMHTIDIRAIDRAGNVSNLKTFEYYIDNTAPEISNVKIKTKDKTELGNDWTSDSDPHITVGSIKDDESGLDKETFKYAVKKSDDGKPENNEYKIPANLHFDKEENGDVYSADFDLDEGDRNKNTGDYKIYVKVCDKAGTTGISSVSFRKDIEKPTEIMTIKSGGKIVTELEDTVQVIGNAEDNHSGVADSNVKMYKKNDDREEYVATIYSGYSIDKEMSLDTRKFANGNYILKMNVIDNAGNTSDTLEKAIKIANKMEAPKVTTTPTAGATGKVHWEYKSEKNNLKEIQYKLESADTWSSVPAIDKKSGDIDIELPSEEGSYNVAVRPIDSENVVGKERAAICIVDKTAPTAELVSFDQCILKGTAADERLSKWEVGIKEKNSEESSYLKILSGTGNIENDTFGIIDITNSIYNTGVTYTIKLVAEDVCGNKKIATMDVTKTEKMSCAKVIEPAFRIERPDEQEYVGENIEIGTNAKAIGIKTNRTIGIVGFNTDNAKWYENNTLAATGEKYKGNADTGFKEKTKDGPIKIASVIHGLLGNPYYSMPLVENATSENISFVGSENSEQGITKTIRLSGPAVSFRLYAASEKGENTWTYQVKKGDGSFEDITLGETVTAEFISGTLEMEEITVRAIMPNGSETSKTIETKIVTDTIEKETYTVSKMENYRPVNVSAKDKINYKTYIKWTSADEDAILNKDVTYEVFRGTSQGFTPSEENLVAKDIAAFYFSDPNIEYSGKFYYRIQAVEKNATGETVKTGSFSKEVSSKVVDSNEYTKRMGSKEYWDYAKQQTPSGNISIEKSEGNMMYSQSDVEVDNEKLPVEITRVYNSKSSAVSAFGKGWNHNYDLELLNICGKDDANTDDYVFKDAEGTIYTFTKKKGRDGFVSSMGKEYNLKKEEKTETINLENSKVVNVSSSFTMNDKENAEYRFNRGGQLVYMTEPNGNYMLFDYDKKKGVLTKATTSKNIQVEFKYENSNYPLLITGITLPDDTGMEYTYDDEGNLVNASRVAGNNHIDYRMEYTGKGSDETVISKIRDGMGNAYQIGYNGDKADSITAPDSSGIRLTYNSGRTTEETMHGLLAVSQTTTKYDQLSGNKESYIDEDGRISTYEYRDGLLSRTTRETEHEKLVDGKVVMVPFKKIETTTYDENDNPSKETDEDGNVTLTSYGSKENTVNQAAASNETTPDGTLVSDEEYYYDDDGNEIKCTDSVDDRETDTEYYEDGEVSSETEKEEGAVTKKDAYEYSYDSEGNKVAKQTSVSGGITTVTSTTYDKMGRELKVKESYTGGTADSSKETVNIYDGFGRLLKTTLKETNDKGTKTTVSAKTYNDNGSLVSQTTNGTVTEKTYDNMNRVVSSVSSKNGEAKTYNTAYTYGTVNIHTMNGAKTVNNAAITTESIAGGGVASETYTDVQGKTVREKSKGLYTDYTYDAEGNVIAEYAAGQDGTDGSGKMIAHVFDSYGNETATIENPESENSITTTKKYDQLGNNIASTDGKGNTTEYTYDSKSRLTNVKLPSGRIQSVAYKTTTGGNIETTVTDAKGNKSIGFASATGTEISKSYKGDGSVTSITTSYEYDAEGRQIKSKNTEDNYKLSVYDAKGQTLQTKTFDKTGEPTMTSKYSYDISGNMTEEKDYEVKDGIETLLRGKTYEYTGLDKLSKVTETDGGRTSTISYSYDMEDNLTGITYGGNANNVEGLVYVYNDYKWLTEIRAVILGNTKTLREYAYTNDGKVATIKDHRDMGSASGNDFTQIDFSYDDFDRPVKMEYRENGTGEVRESYAVKYDKNGSIISEDAANGYPSSEDSGKLDRLKEYTYDVDGQLTATEIKDDIDNTVKNISYTYDAAGNRTKETESGSGTDDGRVTTDYTYNSLDQMTGAKTMQEEDTVSDKKYAYDGNGNQIKEADSENKITNIMTYDGENRLSTVTKKEIKPVEASEDSEDTDGDGITENTEEEVTTKVQSNKYNGSGQRISKTEGNNTTKYFYQDGAVLYTTDGNNGMTSFNMLGTEGNIIASARNENGSEKYYYYNKDIRNSTTNMLDTDGNAAVSYDYDDFGETTKYGTLYNETAYTGGIYDESTGLYYLNARYYDPENGTFTSQDTYRGEQEDPGTWNLYSYCANDPVNFVDPSGHKSIMSIYYNYNGGSGGFAAQAHNSSYYDSSSAKMKPFQTKNGFKKAWKSIGNNYKKVYIYTHSYAKRLCMKNGATLSSKKLAKYTKKRQLKSIHLISCHGASGGRKSLAYALYKLTNKNAKIYASKVSVSFRKATNREGVTKYYPRYSKAYCKKHGYKYYYRNPVKKVYE